MFLTEMWLHCIIPPAKHYLNPNLCLNGRSYENMLSSSVGVIFGEVMNIVEEWIHVNIAPDYEVSNLGRLRRATDAMVKINTKRGRLHSLKPDSKTGYVRCSLRSRDGKLLREQVHRLVGRAFLGEHRIGSHINHKDGIKSNNVVDNLEWCTPQENVVHAWATGLNKAKCGQEHPRAKLKEQDIKVIRGADARGVQLNKIAEVFNVTNSCIGYIVRNHTWKEVV